MFLSYDLRSQTSKSININIFTKCWNLYVIMYCHEKCKSQVVEDLYELICTMNCCVNSIKKLRKLVLDRIVGQTEWLFFCMWFLNIKLWPSFTPTLPVEDTVHLIVKLIWSRSKKNMCNFLSHCMVSFLNCVSRAIDILTLTSGLEGLFEGHISFISSVTVFTMLFTQVFYESLLTGRWCINHCSDRFISVRWLL